MSTQTVTFASDEITNQDDLETAVLKLIREDPFSSIGEMKQEINVRSDALQVGWWELFFLLKRKKLLTRRSRFRLFRAR